MRGSNSRLARIFWNKEDEGPEGVGMTGGCQIVTEIEAGKIKKIFQI